MDWFLGEAKGTRETKAQAERGGKQTKGKRIAREQLVCGAAASATGAQHSAVCSTADVYASSRDLSVC